MPDDDLKTIVREFRASVAADLEATHRRMDELSDEVRARITTAETAILNEIRDLGGRLDRRVERGEAQTAELERSMTGLDTRMGTLETRMGTFETRLDGLDENLASIAHDVHAIAVRIGGSPGTGG